MRRREFIAGLGGAAVAWPLAAGAQQVERVQRVGVLTIRTENEPIAQPAIVVFREGMAKLGWVEGRNLRLDIRFGGTDPSRLRAYAVELVSLDPDVIVTSSAQATRAVQQQTHTIPIVFAAVGDPVAGGMIRDVARPEGNTTGVTDRYDSITGKMVELLKEAAPRVERVALIYNAQFLANGSSQFAAIEEAAGVWGVKAIRIPYSDALDLSRGIDGFAAEPNGSLFLLQPPPSAAERQTILRLATQHQLPTISETRGFAAEGGVMSYGSNPFDVVRRAPFYVDRILRGAKVSELPIEYPTKFELAINLKTAKAIGLTIPPTLLALADQVIE
jgi:putative tryptophan/tyrosine transport system substrate-binding protein